MPQALRTGWGALAWATLLAACLGAPDERDPGDGEWGGPTFDFSGGDSEFVATDSGAFEQVGLILVGGPEDVRLELHDGREWGEPVRPEITWREGELRIGRLILDAPHAGARLVDGGAYAEAQLQLYPVALARPDWPLARDLPTVTNGADAGEFRTNRQQLLPDWVVTREAWGARDPSRVCGSDHTPRYITVHHTVTPTVDSISPAARVRGIQAYHIDSNGWCDVGYHFLVGQDGRVYQGRSSELRTGAHVGGANTDNVGVSFLGTFTTDVPDDSMFSAGADVIRWLSESYDIPLQRDAVRGHREWGSTECPGGALFARLERLLDEASSGGDPDPEPDPDPDPEPEPAETYDVDVDVRLLGLVDRLDEGRSEAVVDTVAGEQFTAEILVTSHSTVGLNDVELTYLIDVPFAVPSSFRIETDAPALDRVTWASDVAEDDPRNPDLINGSGWLYLGALEPGETKRVVVELAGGIASLDHPAPTKVRAWLRRVPGVYELHDRWHTIPTTDRIGRPVRDEARFDSLPVFAWDFEGDYGVEGWSSCGAPLGVSDGALRTGGGACVDSPGWTRIDGARFDQLVLDLESSAPAELSVEWNGGELGGDGDVAGGGVTTPLDEGRTTLVLSVGDRGAWAGDIRELRISSTMSAAETLGVHAVWVQDSESRVSTGPGFSTVSPTDVSTPPDAPVSDPPPDSDAGGRAMQSVRLQSEAGCAMGRGSDPTGVFAFCTLLGIALRRRFRNLKPA